MFRFIGTRWFFMVALFRASFAFVVSLRANNGLASAFQRNINVAKD